ncbi:YpjP family protein [Oceanobacillus bengalensis]|uniref:Cell division protein FtsK n=1 Tax=Oceanobacillus bengalensis TaxID=1435466 RepID=A0A494YR32_9BACI|nr:YpjP family protein [Oceanobacillus bengalensis]RKQ11476.1 hypothetical protein D8M05_19795 [Oceanobacillus bengalensis]
MKLWMRKILVALITVATLGMYTPVALLEVDADNSKDSLSEADLQNREATKAEVTVDTPISQNVNNKAYFIDTICEKAKTQTLMKFGPRIADRVEDEFAETILPTIENVIETLVDQAGDEYIYYGITEQPAKGYGERIFHVYDYRTQDDIARFHVRRDNRPLEGYYFNFHYHLSNDGFKEHHQIGEIFWAKNTPPKWMA